MPIGGQFSRAADRLEIGQGLLRLSQGLCSLLKTGCLRLEMRFERPSVLRRIL